MIEAMLNMLGMRGTAATVGVPPTGAKIEIDPLAYLLGSRGYKGCREGDSNPPVFIPQLCKMQKDGHFPVESTYCASCSCEWMLTVRVTRAVQGVRLQGLQPSFA